jgi:D-alanyl-D-alanine carboxypeptidase
VEIATPSGAPPQAHGYVGEIDSLLVDPSFDLYGGGGLVSPVSEVSHFFRALLTGQVFEKSETLDIMRGVGATPVPGAESAGVSLYPGKISESEFLGHNGFGGTNAMYFVEDDIAITFTLLQSEIPESFGGEQMIAEILALVKTG